MEFIYDANESRYRQLHKLGQKLKIPTLEAFLEVEVRDGNGKIIHHHKQRSHSWVRNAYNLMFSQLAGKSYKDTTFGAGKISAKMTNGNIIYSSAPLSIGQNDVDVPGQGYMAASAEYTWGILVGSGTNAESFESYFLQTQIINGTGPGQISHVASESPVVAYNSGTRALSNTLARYFNNNSGGNISVNEVAIVGLMYGGIRVMTSRDLLGSTITVPNTGQLKVIYTIQLIYPA